MGRGLHGVRGCTWDSPCLPWPPGLSLGRSVAGEMAFPYYLGRMTDWIINEGDPSVFIRAVWDMSLIAVGSAVTEFICDVVYKETMNRTHMHIQSQVFRSVLRQEIAFFHANRTGDITSRVTVDTDAMSEALSEKLNLLMWSGMRGIFLYSLMVQVSPRLALFTTVGLPLILLVPKFSGKFHQAVLRAIQDSLARSGEVVRESVSSIETVRSFATEDEESRRYEAALAETHRLKKRHDLERELYLLFCQVSGDGGTQASGGGSLWLDGLQIRAGLLTKGSLVSFVLYQWDTLASTCGDLLSNVGAAEKVFEYLDREPAVRTDGTRAPESLQGHVSFHNVSFSYPSRPDRQVLKDVSFELRPGEVTALVGLNGSGKSTCVGLLERFYEPQAGEILLDGVPLREYEHRYLHRQVALVGQEPVLFSGSIRENIAYGLGGCGEEQVTRAARAAHASGFIVELDSGFETDVGEKGGQLSAGQKQRIAIARALICQPAVLILDEATSALDIRQSVLSRGRRTVLVIAHRMQMVENADRIVVLEGGAVAEEGTHTELMGRKGPYYRLVQRHLAE
uniref:Uncharacterized protein n=1 Tax=Chrysemys picta bellii TaxID=8478 RepID=A0A8C3FPX2_CHRPI